MLKVTEKSDGITFECRVSPRAGRSAIKGVKDGILQIALGAPPVDGKANEALLKLLSEIFSIPRSRIAIIRGEKGRNKVVFLQNIGKEAVIRALK